MEWGEKQGGDRITGQLRSCALLKVHTPDTILQRCVNPDARGP